MSFKRPFTLEHLLEVMEKMRDSSHGCAWTRGQDWQTLTEHTLEESYELIDAIDKGNKADIKGELADLLNQVVFYCQLAKEEGSFDIYEVIDYLTDKLIKRHPDVFADGEITDIKALEAQWHKIKRVERQQKNDDNNSLLDTIASIFPAMIKAKKIQQRASSIGFDWDDINDVFAKLKSEVSELEAVLEDKDDAVEELGDLMFSCVNLARHLGVDPERVMRLANDKFTKRFKGLEKEAHRQGAALYDLDSEALEALWIKQKHT